MRIQFHAEDLFADTRPRPSRTSFSVWGRTGGREDSARNCLFLAISADAFLQGLVIVKLRRDGSVEPVTPPLPIHLLAQQIMAPVLQEEGLARGMVNLGWTRLPRNPSRHCRTRFRAHARSWDPCRRAGILGIGPRGEVEFGGRNFIELVSALTTPLLMTVRVGTQLSWGKSTRRVSVGLTELGKTSCFPDVVGRNFCGLVEADCCAEATTYPGTFGHSRCRSASRVLATGSVEGACVRKHSATTDPLGWAVSSDLLASRARWSIDQRLSLKPA
jgi:hypothetical protein